MTDIALTDDHDIDVSNNDLHLVATESQSIRQRLIIKILTYQGEWFLNSQLGVPYYEFILGANRSKETIDSIMQTAILEEPEVLEITRFKSRIDTISRAYEMEFTIRVTNSPEVIPIELTI